jgi:ribosomal protein L32
MSALSQMALGLGILVIIGLLFAILLVATRRGQKPSPGTTPKEFSSPACPKCGTVLTQGKPCPKCGASTGPG